MAIFVSGERKAPGTPATAAVWAPEPTRESTRGAVPPNPTAGGVANEEAWEAWKEKGRGNSRPPWWMLLFGLLALSVNYWLWGGAQR
jgi:hypothetical protein